VIVREGTEKVGQEYIVPVLTLSGEAYAAMPFQTLHDLICDALRGGQPRLVAEADDGSGEIRLIFEDGSTQPRREWGK
jgi:hypothetical protein